VPGRGITSGCVAITQDQLCGAFLIFSPEISVSTIHVFLFDYPRLLEFTHRVPTKNVFAGFSFSATLRWGYHADSILCERLRLRGALGWGEEATNGSSKQEIRVASFASPRLPSGPAHYDHGGEPPPVDSRIK